MKRPIIILATLLLVSACYVDGQHSKSAKATGTCQGSVGATTTIVFYGDSELRTTPISHIKPNSEFRFKLKPQPKGSDPVNYHNVEVEIKFKPGDPATWIDVKGSAANATDSTLIVCVPADAKVKDVYEFFIHVDEVGKLDPRAEVY
jgi:hypothetical protein